MKTIWKYPLLVMDDQEILMPKEANPLFTSYVNGELNIWFEVDSDAEKEWRIIRVRGTGNPLLLSEDSKYVGSVIEKGSSIIDATFVWHVYVD